MHLKLTTFLSRSFFQLNSVSSFSLFPPVSRAVFVFLWTCCGWLCCVITQLDAVIKLRLFQCKTEKEDPFFGGGGGRGGYIPVCALESTDFQQGFIL